MLQVLAFVAVGALSFCAGYIIAVVHNDPFNLRGAAAEYYVQQMFKAQPIKLG